MYNFEELKNLIKLAQGNRTQNEYAMYAGIDSSTITKIIKEGRIPEPKTLKKLADRANNGITYEMLMKAAGHINDDLNMHKNSKPENPKNKQATALAEIEKMLTDSDIPQYIKDDLFRKFTELYFSTKSKDDI